jgi:membrane-associated phospholipid phosphatase
LNPDFSYRFARFISTVFVPPSFTIIVFTIFALTLENNFQNKILTILISFIFGFASPIVLFFILRKKGKIIDQDASIKEERTTPFLIAMIFYLVGLLLMIKFDLNIISIAFWFCYFSNTLITIIINKFRKISAHSMGASGAAAATIFVFGLYGIISLVIVFLVGWSRVKLKCHSLGQVLGGIILAFSSVYVQMFLIIKYFG